MTIATIDERFMDIPSRKFGDRSITSAAPSLAIYTCHLVGQLYKMRILSSLEKQELTIGVAAGNGDRRIEKENPRRSRAGGLKSSETPPPARRQLAKHY
jgi:hypothetical protein